MGCRRARWWTVITVLGAGVPSIGLAWGSYGHQQINDAAVTVSARLSEPLGAWLKRNRKLLRRLSITPDCEWKANRGCKVPDDEDLAALTYAADRHEHPLHYFEPDAFLRDGVVNAETAARLPDGPYLDVFRDYIKLMAANMEYVLQFPRKHPISDPSAPTARDVAESGTAPWRARQLFDLAVEALRNDESDLALLYLGTLGHYVGDMTQPFHATMNFDGQVHSPKATGIHSVFESKILERVARQAKAKKNTETKLWSHFHATEAAVLAAAGARLDANSIAVPANAVVREVLLSAADGYRFTEPLLDILGKILEDRSQSVTAAEQQEFLETKVPGTGTTVLGVAEIQMGVAAALLARLWQAAFIASGKAAAALPSHRAAFDPALALKHYPVPRYLPSDIVEGEHEEDPGEEPEEP